MELIKTLFQDYYEGREKSIKDIETIKSIREYSPCLSNILYILGLADSQMEIAVEKKLFYEILYAQELYKASLNLASKIGFYDLEMQINNRFRRRFLKIGGIFRNFNLYD